MAGVTPPPEPITLSKEIEVQSDGVHVEKLMEHEQLVARLNNLDPPVSLEEEKRVVRKIDVRLPPFLLILYIFTWLDRGALGKTFPLPTICCAGN